MRVEKDVRVRNGAANTKTVKVVCGSLGRTNAKYCNDGWMSALDETAKPILRPLVNGEEVELSKDGLANLAAWASKSTITAEFLARSEVAIPEPDRRHLMNRLTPPPHWTIYIAPYHGELWHTGYHHFAIRLDQRGSVEVGPKNAQTTLLGLGRLLIHVSTFPSDLLLKIEALKSARSFRKIWPPSDQVISWPTERFINDAAAGEVAVLLSRILHRKANVMDNASANFVTNAQQAPRKRTVLSVGTPSGSSTLMRSGVCPAFAGVGNEDLICAGCGCVLGKGVAGPDLYNLLQVRNNLLVQCPCGTFNKIPVPSDQKFGYPTRRNL